MVTTVIIYHLKLSLQDFANEQLQRWSKKSGSTAVQWFCWNSRHGILGVLRLSVATSYSLCNNQPVFNMIFKPVLIMSVTSIIQVLCYLPKSVFLSNPYKNENPVHAAYSYGIGETKEENMLFKDLSLLKNYSGDKPIPFFHGTFIFNNFFININIH